MEIQIQTGPTTKTAEVQAAVEPPPRSLKYTPEQAARLLQRIYRRLVMLQRMVIFRQLSGVLFARKYRIGPNSGALEIMSMHMQVNYVDKTCLFLRLTIFDYVTRKFTYSGTYDLLDFVQEFNVHSLLKLSYLSLLQIEFEGPPFKTHIQTLQHIINENREQKLELQEFHLPQSSSSETESERSSSSAYSEPEMPESPKTPPPIFIKRELPLMISSEITTAPDFVEVTEKKPEPQPRPEPVKPVVRQSKPAPAPLPKAPPKKKGRSLMRAVYRI